MTKYINKLNGAELDYDHIYESFVGSLEWDGKTDPEEFLMEAYEFEFESWLLNNGIEEIEVPDPVKPKKTAKRKANAKAKNDKVTTVCDHTIPSFIHLYQEWSTCGCSAQELERITLEVNSSMEENLHLVEEIISLYGNDECAYYEEMYQAPTLQEKRLAFATDLVMTEGFKAAHQCY